MTPESYMVITQTEIIGCVNGSNFKCHRGRVTLVLIAIVRQRLHFRTIVYSNTKIEPVTLPKAASYSGRHDDYSSSCFPTNPPCWRLRKPDPTSSLTTTPGTDIGDDVVAEETIGDEFDTASSVTDFASPTYPLNT